MPTGRESTGHLELRRLITIAKAWLPLMLVAAVLCGGAAYGVSSLQSKVYEAKTSLMVGQALSATNPDYTQLLVAQSLSSTYAAIAKTRPNLEAVITKLGLTDTADELGQRITVDSPSGSTLLTLTAQDTKPERAAAIANALADQLIAVSPSLQGREAEFRASIDQDLTATQGLIDSTQARVDALNANPNRTPKDDAELQSLEGRLVTLRDTYATLLSFSSGSATNLLTMIESAETPGAPVLPRTLLNVLLATLFGILAVAAIAFAAEQLDDSIKSPESIEEVTGLSTLGTISQMKSVRGRSEIYQLAGILYPRSSVTEAYRALRANVEFASVDTPIRTLLVTSAASGEGKTVTAANLAVVFAQTGRKVLLVDADLRKPGVHAMFNLVNTDGLTTMLRDTSVRLDSVAHRTEEPTLRVLTTGPLPPNPAELMGSQRMQAILGRLKQSADIVIFDSPPLTAVTDAAVLSAHMDGTLMVVDASRSRRRVVRLGSDTLARANATVLGAVLNRIPAHASLGYGEYYGVAEASGKGASPKGASSSPGVAGTAADQAKPLG